MSLSAGVINRTTAKARSTDCNHLQADNTISDGDGVEVSFRTGTITDQSIDTGTVTEVLK